MKLFLRRFPHYRQNNVSDCGPTCLRMVAKYHGKVYSAETVRKLCHVSRQGVNLLGINDAARKMGFDTVGVKATFDDLLGEGSFPCILHWNQNHFVVCRGIEKDVLGRCRVKIADPASRLATYTRKEMERCWTASDGKGFALLLEPGEGFFEQEDESGTARGKSLLSYVRYLKPYRGMFLQLALAMLGISGIQAILPFLSQAMVDQGINGRDLGLITLILISQLVFFATSLCIDYIRSWIVLHINARVDIALISDFLLKLTAMPLRFFDSRMTGDILQRIGDHGRVKNFLMSNSLHVVFSMFNFVVFLGILGFYDREVLFVFVVGNTLYVLWISLFMRYRRILDTKRFGLSSREQSKLIQLVHGMQDVKLNNCERKKRWEWERIQVRLFSVSLSGLRIGQVQQTGSAFFTQATHMLIYYMAAKSVVEGGMTLGMMMSLSYIVSQVSAPIGEFVSFAHSFQDAKISLERLNEIHSQPDEEEGIEAKRVTLPLRHDIDIRNVSFSYDGFEDAMALRDVSIRIPGHKVTAIVGESGCGKTTLIKLLLGFYQPTSGTIMVGDADLGMINPHVWREAAGTVMQDSYIFSDTISGNIAVDDMEVDHDRVRMAAMIAQADTFIESLPLRYETYVGMEGMGLSQGQRQRMLIARAVYKNPEFIFLDEATNALDAINEACIMENLNKFYEGRTVVISAHRLSTIRNADQIVVLDAGKVVETGTHDSLLKKRGKYYMLVKNQMGALKDGETNGD